MSKLDDAFEVDRIVAKELRLFAELSTTSKKEIKTLMLETYQSVRDRTRNEYELDELFAKAVEDL